MLIKQKLFITSLIVIFLSTINSNSSYALELKPDGGGCYIQGNALSLKDEEIRPNMFKRTPKRLQGLGLAIIERPVYDPEIKEIKGDKTYKSVESEDQGYYRIVSPVCTGTIFVGVFCGDRVLDVFSFNWKAEDGIADMKTDEKGNKYYNKDLKYNEDLTCANNNYLLRPAPLDGAERKIDSLDEELVYAERLRQPRAHSVNVGWQDVIGALRLCWTQWHICWNEMTKNSPQDTDMKATELLMDWHTRKTAIEYGLGKATLPPKIIEEVDDTGAVTTETIVYPNCEEIKKINQNASTINKGHGGQTLLMQRRPGYLKQFLKDRDMPSRGTEVDDMLPEAGKVNPKTFVCSHGSAGTVKFGEIARPWEPCDPTNPSKYMSHIKLCGEYYPYALSKQLHNGIQKESKIEDYARGETKLWVIPRIQEWKDDKQTVYTCTVLYKVRGGTSTNEKCDIPNTLSNGPKRSRAEVTTRGDSVAILTTNDVVMETGGLINRPGKQFYKEDMYGIDPDGGDGPKYVIDKTEVSGIGRVRFYGKENVCPAAQRKNMGREWKGDCTRGGMRYKITLQQGIENLVQNFHDLIACSKVPPEKTGCGGDVSGSVTPNVDIAAPFDYSPIMDVARSFERPGKAKAGKGCSNAGSISTSKASTEETKYRLPSSSLFNGSPVNAKECIAEAMSRPGYRPTIPVERFE